MAEKEVLALRRRTKRGGLKQVIVVLLIVAGLAGSAFFGLQYKKARDDAHRLADPKAAAQQELDQIVNKVKRFAITPDETPTLATVSDPAKLKGQAFFANAKEGDKLLIYSKAKRAILYRPSADRLVEIAPISVTDGTASGTNTKAGAATETPAGTTDPKTTE